MTKQRIGKRRRNSDFNQNNPSTSRGKLVRLADPLVKKLWLKADSKTIPSMGKALRQHVNNLNVMSPGTLGLELNIVLENTCADSSTCLSQAICAAQDIRIGMEQKFPEIRICVQYDMISESVVKQVGQLDTFNPSIEFYILVPASHMSSFFRFDSAVGLGTILREHHIRFHVFLLLGPDQGSLKCLQNGMVEEFLGWLKESTQLNIYTPVLEVALFPDMRKSWAFAEALLRVVRRHADLLETTGSIYCGLLSLLNKALKMHALLEDQELSPTPILSHCGTASTSSCLPSPILAQIRACPYGIPNLKGRLSVISEKCPNCPWVSYCSGCLKALSLGGKCRLQPYYAALCSFLCKRPRTISKFITKKGEIPILEHDWDYIYDPFGMP